MTRLMTGVADAQQKSSHGQKWGLLREFAASGISVGCANTVLNPVGELQHLILRSLRYLAAKSTRTLERVTISPSKVFPQTAQQTATLLYTMNSRTTFPLIRSASPLPLCFDCFGTPAAVSGQPQPKQPQLKRRHIPNATANITASSFLPVVNKKKRTSATAH
jgi:hypothetical protein